MKKNIATQQNSGVNAGGSNPAVDTSHNPRTASPTSAPPATLQFQEIPIGGHFEFRGRRYQKLALNIASDEDKNGTLFQAQTEVLPDPFSESSLPTPPA